MAVDKVLDHLVECVPKMQMPVGIGRSVVKNEQVARVVFTLPSVEIAGAALAEKMLTNSRIRTERELGFGEQQRRSKLLVGLLLGYLFG